MIFYQIDGFGDRNFGYLLGAEDGGPAVVFDPPPGLRRYAHLIEQHNLKLEYVVITHGHGDHTWGVAPALKQFGCKVVGHKSIHAGIDVPVDDGDKLDVGGLSLEFLYTPGHTEDSICTLCNGKLITGDTLFVGKVGGTDLGEGARHEWESLHKLMKLPRNTEVWPGHNYGLAPSSTIGIEIKTNPFLTQKSFDDFIDLKTNWLQYKKEHNIP